MNETLLYILAGVGAMTILAFLVGTTQEIVRTLRKPRSRKTLVIDGDALRGMEFPTIITVDRTKEQ